jgi:hypothetical protein
MRKSGIIFVFSIAATLAISFGARTASALICCTVCDANPNNPACFHGCSPTCAVDDEPIVPDIVVPNNVGYDDVAKVCYATTSSDSDVNVQDQR